MFVLLPENKVLNLGGVLRAVFTEEPRELKLAMADGETLVLTNHIARGVWGLIGHATMFSINDKGELGQKVANPNKIEMAPAGTVLPPLPRGA